MKILKNISLYKTIMIFFLLIHFKNYYIFTIGFIYLLIDNIDNLYLLIILLFLCLLFSYLRKDFIKVGIIDYKNNDYYLVDSLLYKSKLYTDEELMPGDILLFNDSFINNNQSNLNNNILYYHKSFNKIFNIEIRNILFNHINNKEEGIKNILFKIFYNLNIDYSSYNVLFTGLISYYFLLDLINKNKTIGTITLFIYSLLFCFQIKFILIILNIVLDNFELEKLDKISIKFLIIYYLNNNLINNYSILLPLLISLINCFNLKYKSYFYITLITSYLFGSINIIYTFLFSNLIKYKKIIFVLGIVLMFLPINNLIFIKKIIELLNISNLIIIRGSLSIIGMIILFLICLINKNNTLISYIAIILIVCLPINRPLSSISFIDVGQGDAILIKDSLNSSNVLIDTGSIYNYQKLKKYLFKNSIYKLDYLIISHDDSDHNGNIDNLKNDFKINNLILEGKDIKTNNLLFKYLYIADFDNDNDNSLVYSLNIDNYSFLFTGDISKNAERKFVDKYIGDNYRYDFLKVAHHGSNTSTSSYFIESILPKYAIISTSGMYNHPSKETINTLNKYLVNIFNTKKDGNIEIYFSRIIDFIKCKDRFVIIG